jgi:CBS domain containing-hemolysin-like protein
MTDFWLKFFSVVFLIGINAFFVTAEFSIVSVRRSRINQLVEAGDLQAQTIQSLQRSIDRLLSTTQLGITLSSLALGWIGENTMAVIVFQLLARLPLPPDLTYWLAHSLAIPIAFFLIAYLQIVLGELCPKSLALMYSEQLARFFAPAVGAIAKIFNPFIYILNQSTRWLLRLVGIEYNGQGWHGRVTPEELQLIITTEKESTGLEAEERELLKNVFEFGDVLAEEVMIPRIDIDALTANDTFAQLLQAVADTGHSRYPVIQESLDHIMGIIDFKDLALPLAEGKITRDSQILDWIKPVTFIPESTTLSELLPLMQASNLKMVIVVDEFGGTAGLVTLQNLIAEIIGDESEDNKDDFVYLVQANLDIEEVNELLNINLPITDEYQTLAGFIIYQWQKIPSEGEKFPYDNLELTIMSVNGPRLEQVMIHKRETVEENNSEEIDDN